MSGAAEGSLGAWLVEPGGELIGGKTWKGGKPGMGNDPAWEDFRQ